MDEEINHRNMYHHKKYSWFINLAIFLPCECFKSYTIFSFTYTFPMLKMYPQILMEIDYKNSIITSTSLKFVDEVRTKNFFSLFITEVLFWICYCFA